MYKQIIRKSIKDIFDNYHYLLKVLLIPSLLLIAISYYLLNNPVEDKIAGFVLNFVSAFINVLIAVSVHRVILLGHESVPRWGLIPSSREIRFIGIYIGLVLLIALISGILVAILGTVINKMVLIALLILAFLPIFSRLSMVFPAISIDKPMTLRESWDETRGYTFLILITLIVFPVLFSLVFGIIYGLALKLLTWMISPQLQALEALINVVISVFVVSALSSTYYYIVSNKEVLEEME